MKLVSKEEREAHAAFVAAEGAKGLFYGAVVSLGLFSYLKIRHTGRFLTFNTSIKAAVLTMPTIALSAFWAEQGSVEFDRRMYSAGAGERNVLEEYWEWKAKPAYLKMWTTVKNHKYQALFSVWGVSLFAVLNSASSAKGVESAVLRAQFKRFVRGSSVALLVASGAIFAAEKTLAVLERLSVPSGGLSEDKEAERRRISEEIRAAQEELAALRARRK